MNKDLQFSPFTGNVFGRSYAAQGLSLPAPREEKSLSPEMSAWMRAEDVDPSGEGAKLTSPYSQSPWVYIAVSRLAEKVSSIPFRISRMDSMKAKRVRALRSSSDPRHRSQVRRALGETIIESGDVVDLFNRPHPMMNRQLFWEMVVTWNCLRGEFFIVPLDGTDQPVDLATSAPRVQRLLTLPTEMFWHIVTGYDLAAWRYTGSPLVSPLPSEMLLPSEVIHSHAPNPYSFWRGMSPLIVAMVAAGADYAASQYNKGYWLNNADTGVIVTTDQQASKEQRDAILAALRERKRKAGTADRPLFLWGGAKVEKPQLSGMESQFIENRKMNRQEIGAIFKVPDSVMGFSDAKSSALSGGGNAINQEAIGFVENTICPLCEHIEAAVEPVVKTFGEGLIGWFDVECLPVMQEARRSRLDSGVKAFGIGAAFNDINRVYDLGFPEYPGWGNQSFLPFSLAPAGESPEMPGEDEPPDDEKEKSNPFARMERLIAGVGRQVYSEEQRAPNLEHLWKSHMATRRKSVKAMQSKVSKVLFEFRRTTLEKLDGIELPEKTIDRAGWLTQRSLIDLIFNATAFGQRLLEELKHPITHTLKVAGDEMREELGFDDPWKMPPQKAKEHLAARTQEIMDTGQTVRTRINNSLNEGLDAGETMDELTDRVGEVFNDMTRYEASRVARTETNIAYNSARQDVMKETNVAFKAWLSSHGPHVRPAHAQAERDYSMDTPIPIDQPFRVGGEELMYPGDDSMGASAGNIINCQCVQLAVKKKSESATSITFEIIGLGEFTFTRGVASAVRCPCEHKEQS